jgi:hypothetical protein
MADAGLMLGWHRPTRGREKAALEVFNNSVAYYGRLQSEGRIESFEIVFLRPHGGDLDGFMLMRGSADQMAAVTTDEEFERIVQAADLTVDGIGVIDCLLGDGIARALGQYIEVLDTVETAPKAGSASATNGG